MTEDNVHQPAGEYPSRRPGHELCAARERARISREEIARTLHLPQEQVDALEADQYARLPPPAYVRGYLRAYAREVGMDPDQVVADYDAICGEAEDPVLVIHHGQPDPAAARGPVLALLVVVAVALVGAVAWWLQQPALSPIATQEGMATDEAVESAAVEPAMEAGEPAAVAPAEPEAPAVPEPAEPTEPTAPEVPESATTEPAADGGSDTPTVAAGDTTADATAVATTEPEAATGGTGAGETAGAGTEPTAAAEPAAVEPGAESMVAEGDQPTATSQAELVPTEAAAQGPDRLVVDVDGESWLEVFDARGRQLAYTLYSGDEPVELNGWAPFDVFLGNSPDVTLRFEGSAVDHSAFVRSDSTARFVVDSNGARRR